MQPSKRMDVLVRRAVGFCHRTADLLVAENSFKRRRPEEYCAYLPRLLPHRPLQFAFWAHRCRFCYGNVNCALYPGVDWILPSAGLSLIGSASYLGCIFTDVLIGAVLGSACASFALSLLLG